MRSSRAGANIPASPARNRVRIVVWGLIAVNVGVWALLLTVSRRYPFLLGLGALAYVFGMRHAVDADHIAAIDNTTRKLINDGHRPLGVGFFFSLGHASIVCVLALGMALSTHVFKSFLAHVDLAAGLIGTLSSALFLYLIAILNLVVLKDIYGVFREIRRSRLSSERMAELEEALLKRGLMNRLLGRFYSSIRASWQMYPVGFLFGLGFDTPSEMAVLGMSVLAAGRSVPIWTLSILPLVFSSGMILVDTLDGIMMQSAYSWAFINPLRKVYYNLSITSISVVIALGVGSVELMQVLASELALKGAFWERLQGVDFGTLGYAIIGILLLGWALAILAYRVSGLEKAEA